MSNPDCWAMIAQVIQLMETGEKPNSAELSKQPLEVR